ncbi:flagellar basal body rod C-terminal domain-containing protein, partial [Alicyclobacillus cellulosilyticus]|uniref:flagellar basal body rod C-terminal domain-containing protein n=1 Tax=Alicyclobacillus cellulosilyticus TaxID=1003997 RepID=UPI001666D5EF
GAGAGQAGTGATGAVAQGGLTVASVLGPIAVGPGGRLTAGGLPLAVLDAAGQAIPGIYAVRNPAYQGSGLLAADGKPDYDAAGQPSYLFADANGRIVGRPGDAAWQGAALRIGSDVDMGDHSFFAVAYSSSEVPAGVALTRDGHLSLNSQNELVDAAGHPILPVGPNGLPLPQARIVINPAYQGHDLFAPNGDPVYDQHGQPSYRVVGPGGQVVPGARLGLVDADVTRLVPLGETEFMVGGTLNPQQVVAALRPGTGQLAPGKLEQSNVDPAATMTRMLAVIAQYQANQEVIRAEDETLAKAVQDVGHVNA